MDHPYWPLFDLRLHTPRLRLRLPTDDDLVRLAALAAEGIHDPDVNPFTEPWTAPPSPEMERGFLRFHWRARGSWSPESWNAVFAVEHEGELVGSQGVEATDFAHLREVQTGSWLGRTWQGRGLGTEMRAAVLHLAFAGLGAVAANTDARVGNAASEGVTRSLGYEVNGVRRVRAGDEVYESRHFRLTREQWVARARDRFAVRIEGLDPCRPFFGVDAP